LVVVGHVVIETFRPSWLLSSTWESKLLITFGRQLYNQLVGVTTIFWLPLVFRIDNQIFLVVFGCQLSKWLIGDWKILVVNRQSFDKYVWLLHGNIVRWWSNFFDCRIF
jgi:hypothetical protein